MNKKPRDEQNAQRAEDDSLSLARKPQLHLQPCKNGCGSSRRNMYRGTDSVGEAGQPICAKNHGRLVQEASTPNAICFRKTTISSLTVCSSLQLRAKQRWLWTGSSWLPCPPPDRRACSDIVQRPKGTPLYLEKTRKLTFCAQEDMHIV
jgi:hypothetical protein